MSMTENDIFLVVKRMEERLKMLESQEPLNSKKTDENSISIGDFIRSKNPKSGLEFALTIGYYCEKIQGIFPFTLENIKEGFIKAKEPLPANPSDLIYQGVKRGLIMKTSPKKKDNFFPLIMTNSGEKFVESLPIT